MTRFCSGICFFFLTLFDSLRMKSFEELLMALMPWLYGIMLAPPLITIYCENGCAGFTVLGTVEAGILEAT